MCSATVAGKTEERKAIEVAGVEKGEGGECDMIYNEIINLEKRRMTSVTSTLSELVALREHVGGDTHFT